MLSIYLWCHNINVVCSQSVTMIWVVILNPISISRAPTPRSTHVRTWFEACSREKTSWAQEWGEEREILRLEVLWSHSHAGMEWDYAHSHPCLVSVYIATGCHSHSVLWTWTTWHLDPAWPQCSPGQREGEGRGRVKKIEGEREEEVMCWQQASRQCNLTSSSAPGSVSPAYSNQTRTSPTYTQVYTLPDHGGHSYTVAQTPPTMSLHSSSNSTYTELHWHPSKRSHSTMNIITLLWIH